MFCILPRCKVLLLISIFLFSSSAIGGSKRHFYVGSCLLSQDPINDDTFSPRPIFCIKGDANVESMISTKAYYPRHEILDGYAYVGSNYSPNLSFHSKIMYRTMHYPPSEEKQNENLWAQKNFFFQIGNPTMTRWRSLIGFLDLPFAINLSVLPEAIRAFVKKSDRFFPSPVYGYNASFQDLMGSQIEFAVGDSSSFKEITPYRRNKMVSIRASKDISALNGVRFSLSGFEGPANDRRLSVSMVNSSPNQALTAIEWTRLGKKATGVLTKSDQLIRFQYSEDPESEKRWLFEYEDEFRNYWLTSMGYEKKLLQMSGATIKSTISFYRSRDSSQQSHLILTFGCGGKL